MLKNDLLGLSCATHAIEQGKPRNLLQPQHLLPRDAVVACAVAMLITVGAPMGRLHPHGGSGSDFRKSPCSLSGWGGLEQL